ncbi:hypothetical protein GBAR_LOCUS28399, partial [Geodia barretti]
MWSQEVSRLCRIQPHSYLIPSVPVDNTSCSSVADLLDTT